MQSLGFLSQLLFEIASSFSFSVALFHRLYVLMNELLHPRLAEKKEKLNGPGHCAKLCNFLRYYLSSRDVLVVNKEWIEILKLYGIVDYFFGLISGI